MTGGTAVNSNIPADRYADIKERLLALADEDQSIRAVIAIGSSVREDSPADEFSDLDLFIITADPEGWLEGDKPRQLGKVCISFTEPTLGGGRERRCIYEGQRDVDMIILTPEQFGAALREGVAGWVMNRGFRFLLDREGYAAPAEKYITPGVSRQPMSEGDFLNTVNDFCFHNIWAYKKLLRGELWSAKMCIDAYLKRLLLAMAEEYHALSGRDVWHDGRFLDRWAEPEVLDSLTRCFAHYDPEDCKRALAETHRLFAKLSEAVAAKRGFAYPGEALEYAAGSIGMQDDNKKGLSL